MILFIDDASTFLRTKPNRGLAGSEDWRSGFSGTETIPVFEKFTKP
jgi:hypothetical protein